MPMNLNKCNVLYLGKFNVKRQYCIDSNVIEEERVLKDLGVLIDCTLKFTDHISNIVSSANRLIGLLKRTFLCITPDI